MQPTLDVVIVGAGLSGLQAATDVQDAGLSYTILEARDRIGGKTLSFIRNDGKGIQEAGAAWINDSNQDRVWKLVQKFGLHTITQPADGKVGFEDSTGLCHSFAYGEMPHFSESDSDNIVKVRDIVEVTGNDPETFEGSKRTYFDSITFEDFLRSHGAERRALQTATIWCNGMLGVAPCEVSALCFLEICRGGLGISNIRSDRKHGPQYLRIQEGTQSISTNMAALLSPGAIQLNSPVTDITQMDANTLMVLAGGREILARRVIVTVPGPAYKNVTFSPPLSPARSVYINACRYGYYVKFLVLFKTPFWRQAGYCGLGQSFSGPVSIFRDTSVDAQDNYALTCFISSSTGRRWRALSEDQRQATVLKQIAKVFDVPQSKVKENFLEALTSPWMDDKWAGFGCPFAAVPPGAMGSTDQELLHPQNGIHFVGTELTNEWRGYMDGALRSGERGAAEVIAALEGTSAKFWIRCNREEIHDS